jgi:hypothetical protein
MVSQNASNALSTNDGLLSSTFILPVILEQEILLILTAAIFCHLLAFLMTFFRLIMVDYS